MPKLNPEQIATATLTKDGKIATRESFIPVISRNARELVIIP